MDAKALRLRAVGKLGAASIPIVLWLILSAWLLVVNEPAQPSKSDFLNVRLWSSVVQMAGPVTSNSSKAELSQVWPPCCLFYLLLFSTSFLVTINTVFYLKALHDASEAAKDEHGRGLRTFGFWAAVFSLVASVAWLIDTDLLPETWSS
jgi:hypothetical protein